MDHRILTESTSFYKRVAKTQLRGKWAQAVAAALIYVLVLNIMDIIVNLFMYNTATSALSGIYYWLIFGPITVGFYSFLMRIVRNEESSLGNCFEGFENFGRSFVLGFLTILFIGLWTLLFVIPGIIAAYRYALAPMLLRDRPELSPMECIRESKRLMTGNKAGLFTLNISFIGWAILAAAAVSIIMIVILNDYDSFHYTIMMQLVSTGLLAYMKTAEVVFYEEAIKPIPSQFGGYGRGMNGGEAYEYRRADSTGGQKENGGQEADDESQTQTENKQTEQGEGRQEDERDN